VEALKPADPAALRVAVLFALAGEGVLTLMDACIKSLTPRYPILEVTFLRFAMGSIFASVVFALMQPRWPTKDALHFHAMRSVLIVFTAVSFFYALSKIPIADAMALSFLAPLFIALFGVLLLNESIDLKIAVALAAGIVGMIIIVGGKVGTTTYQGDAIYGAAAAVASAVAYSLVLVLLRSRTGVDPLPTIVLLQNIGPALVLGIPALLVWTTPSVPDLALFGFVGFLGVAGHSLVANAFKRAEAARLAPVHYSVLVWGIFYGFIFFGEVPGLATLAGAALILSATVLTQRHSRIRSRDGKPNT
jgi:drug/metabolite transporter (DMT)-like permease